MEVIHSDYISQVRCNTTTGKYYYTLHSCTGVCMHIHVSMLQGNCHYMHEVFKELRKYEKCLYKMDATAS